MLGKGLKFMVMGHKTIKYGNEQLESVQSLFASKKQISLILAFSEGEKSLKKLESLTNSKSQNLLPKIGELIEKGILKKSERGIYKATPSGEIIISKMLDFLDIYEMLEKEFWKSHNFNVIPRPLLLEITALSNSSSIQPDATLDTSQRLTAQFFKNAKERILGISPVVTLDWAKTIITQANCGVKVSLITTEKVLKMANAEEFREYDPLNHPNISLWINNNIELAFMTNEEHITLALPATEKNIPDMQNILVCQNPESVEWGKKLFEYFKEGSHKINTY